MIPIWIVVIIAGVSYWLGYFARYVTTIEQDVTESIDAVDNAVHRHMEDGDK